MDGKIIIFSAPSGSGKSTLVHYLIENCRTEFTFSVSATSRAPRGQEHDGVDYFFISADEFRKKIAENAFVEYEEVYDNCFYGTLRSEVDAKLATGATMLFDVDVKGGLNIKRQYGDRALAVFVQPPSIEELRRRLVGRGTDAPEMIKKRIAKAEWELRFAPQFDQIVINDNLDQAKAQVLQVVSDFLKK